MSVQAGPYTVTKVGPTSLTAHNPTGGLSIATEFDVNVDGTGYGFTKGSLVPWFSLSWSDTEVGVYNWEHWAGKSITAVQFYAYPYPGPLFGGWQQLSLPILMGEPLPDACP